MEAGGKGARMKQARKSIWALAVLCAILAALAAVLFFRLSRQKTDLAWEDYNRATDYLFQSLSKTRQTGREVIVNTGLIGIPWAQGDDDSMNGNSGMPRKRVLQVDIDDTEIMAYVVTYYAPQLHGSGFAGVFRQNPQGESHQMLSSTTSYVSGMLVTSFVFAKNEEEINENAIVVKEMALCAEVQKLLETLPAA